MKTLFPIRIDYVHIGADSVAIFTHNLHVLGSVYLYTHNVSTQVELSGNHLWEWVLIKGVETSGLQSELVRAIEESQLENSEGFGTCPKKWSFQPKGINEWFLVSSS